MLSFRSWIWFAIVIALFNAPVLGRAATFNVTPNGDSDCTDLNCGLQAALDAAQNNNQADTLLLAPGNYDASGGTFFYPSNDVLAAAENFPLTLRGSDPTTTTLNGGDLQQVMLINTSNLTADDNADILVEGLTFEHGNSVGERGGGLFIETNDADIALNHCQILNNTSDDFGGGVELDSFAAGNIVASGNLIVGNISTNEESGADVIGTDGNITLVNNIFFNNKAPNGIAGGAFVSYFSGLSTSGVITIVNNTFVGNTSSLEGGGLWMSANSGGIANVYNNIAFGNTAGVPGDDIFFNDANLTINLFNNDLGEVCFESTSACDPTAVTGLNQAGNLSLDPLLVDPANGNFNLGIGSQVIDKGDAAAPSLPTIDFAGNPRIIGPAPDMGALEALPDIDVSPTSLGFGNVGLHTKSTLILTIANKGAGILDVNSLELGDGVNYSLDPTLGPNPCGTLAPSLANGESCTLGVVFGPTVNGASSSTLTIASNDPDEAQVVVALSGNGGVALISGSGCSLEATSSGSISWLLAMAALVPALYFRKKKIGKI